MVVSSAILQNLCRKFLLVPFLNSIHCVMLHFQRSVIMPDKLEAFLEVFVCEQWTVLFNDEYCKEQYINQLDASILDRCFRVGSSQISPDFNVIMVNKQCKFSKWSASCLHIGEEWLKKLKRKDKWKENEIIPICSVYFAQDLLHKRHKQGSSNDPF